MKKELVIATLTSCIGSVALGGGAAEAPQVPEGLLACSNIQDTAERVRCYDAQVAAMKKAEKNSATRPSAASAPPAPGSAAAPVRPAPPAALPAAGAPATAAQSGEGTTSSGSVAPSVAPPAPPQPSIAPGPSGAARFGEEELPFAQTPKRHRNEETLSSSITAVTQAAPGIYYFSLANGQVWRADGSRIANSSVIPHLFGVGVPIRIERGALGSYHMSSPEAGTKNWMYVRRVR